MSKISRFAVIHEDDVGMNHGANTAFLELQETGICTSGSVMVPCPWFPEAAQMARHNPQLDLGVHLTLNSEAVGYKWRPLTGVCDNGLTGPDGYFWDSVPDVRRHARPDAVEAELRTQIQAALDAGIEVTHLDCHMGAAMMPEFVDIYERLGSEFNLPLLLMRDYLTFSVMGYVGPVTMHEYDRARDRAARRGNPVVDLQVETPWEWPNGRDAAYEDLFSALPEGISWLAFHFSTEGEISPIDGEARCRIGEYELFRSGRVHEMLKEQGIVPIGVRQWRDSMAQR